MERVSVFECRYPPRLEEGVRSLGAGLTYRNEPPDVVAGMKFRPSCKTTVAPEIQISSYLNYILCL